MRHNYWSCSKFADWLRGTPKPSSASSKDWQLWHDTAFKLHKFRYWLAEDFLDFVQDFVNWPLDKLYEGKFYFANRFITRTNALVANKSHIKPGQYVDMDTRILNCLFDELVNYVEIELAHMHIVSDSDIRKEHRFWQVGKWRLRTWRNAEYGLKYLEWETSLVNNDGTLTPHGIGAKEIRALYDWWTVIRPARKDSNEVSGYNAFYDKTKNTGFSFLDEESKPEILAVLKVAQEIDNQYYEEDTEMLCRLIKIRGNLWT